MFKGPYNSLYLDQVILTPKQEMCVPWPISLNYIDFYHVILRWHNAEDFWRTKENTIDRLDIWCERHECGRLYSKAAKDPRLSLFLLGSPEQKEITKLDKKYGWYLPVALLPDFLLDWDFFDYTIA